MHFDNFFQGGTIPLFLDVMRPTLFYCLLIDVDKTQKSDARKSRNREYLEYPADYVQLSGTVTHSGSWPWCYMLQGSWTPDLPSKYGWLSFLFTLANRHVPWRKIKVQDPQGPASSIHFRILGSQGPMSSIHFRILGFQGPTSSIPFRIQGSQGPTSGIHSRILGSQGPMTSTNFRIQSPQGPTT